MSQWLPFIIVNEIETQFSDINKNIINVSIGFSINVDTTNKDKLSIDLANY